MGVLVCRFLLYALCMHFEGTITKNENAAFVHLYCIHLYLKSVFELARQSSQYSSQSVVPVS